MFKKLDGLMSMEGNYLRYRQVLKQTSPPAVPFLGVFLSDLTFLDDGNPDSIAPQQTQPETTHQYEASSTTDKSSDLCSPEKTQVSPVLSPVKMDAPSQNVQTEELRTSENQRKLVNERRKRHNKARKKISEAPKPKMLSTEDRQYLGNEITDGGKRGTVCFYDYLRLGAALAAMQSQEQLVKKGSDQNISPSSTLDSSSSVSSGSPSSLQPISSCDSATTPQPMNKAPDESNQQESQKEEKEEFRLINWVKRRTMGKVIREYYRFQAIDYCLEPMCEIQEILLEMQTFTPPSPLHNSASLSLSTSGVIDEKELYALSLQREPRRPTVSDTSPSSFVSDMKTKMTHVGHTFSSKSSQIFTSGGPQGEPEKKPASIQQSVSPLSIQILRNN